MTDPAIPRDEELSGNVTPMEERGEDYYGPAKDDLLKALEGLDLQTAEDTTSTSAPNREPPPPPPAEAALPPAARPAPASTSAPAKQGLGAAKPAPAAPPANETSESDAPPPNPFAQLFRAREEAQRAREARNPEAEAQRLREEAVARAKEEADRIVREATERAQREADAILHGIKTNPLEAFRKVGWRGEDIVEATRLAGTKEWQLAQEALEAAKAASARAEGAEKKLSSWEQREQQRAQELAQQDRVSTERAFLRDFASPTKCATLYAALEDAGMDADETRQTILSRAYRIDEAVAQAQQIGITSDPAVRALVNLRATDRVAYFDKLATFLESGAAERRGKRLEPGAPATTTATTAAATKQRAPSGSRTLSATSGSEHRAGPKPFTEMTPEEQRADLIREQAAAIAALKGQATR